MKNYVAYHSASVMGRPYEHEPGTPFVFSSSKSEGFLRSMLGHPTWVIASEKQAVTTRYSLAGVFTPVEMRADDDIWDVIGPGRALSPFVDVTTAPWFALLLKEQANFSLGLNAIKSEEVVAALTRALSLDDRALAQLEESTESFEEGKSVRIVVNRYERDRAARAACLEAHGRICVVCRVDLASVYGPISWRHPRSPPKAAG
jgi:hypothetical protein